jgi:hypothetical protein
MSFDGLVTGGGDNANAISGYLYKQTKDGRWQRRWFETNGNYLTYYKSRKMEKLLAALSMPQVGEIKLLPNDGETGLFCMELNSRVYTLRAKTNEEAAQWVAVLHKLKKQGVNPSQTAYSPSFTPSKENQRLSSSGTPDSESSRGSWIKTGRLCGCCC